MAAHFVFFVERAWAPPSPALCVCVCAVAFPCFEDESALRRDYAPTAAARVCFVE